MARRHPRARGRLLWRVLAAILLLPVAGFGSVERWFAPAKEPWERWTSHDPASTARIDHEAWTALLRKYLEPREGDASRFRYAAVTQEDRESLAGYVAGLAAVPVARHNRSEQRAFWINLYNALTVKVVLDRYPVESIRDIDLSPGLFDDGPWDAALVVVEGEALTLNDIEHRVLRPIWNDPRIHYAVNCASIGCPSLQPVAFTADNAEALLEAGARSYVNSPRGVRFVGGRLIVSSIYDWFIEDFGNDEAEVLAHLRRYAEPALAARLSRATRIDGAEYAWSLNDAAP